MSRRGDMLPRADDEVDARGQAGRQKEPVRSRCQACVLRLVERVDAHDQREVLRLIGHLRQEPGEEPAAMGRLGRQRGMIEPVANHELRAAVRQEGLRRADAEGRNVEVMDVASLLDELADDRGLFRFPARRG